MERIQRVNQLIKKELNQIILREVDFPKDVLVTMTRVESSGNLIQAKVYISVMFTPHRNEVSGAGPENKSTQVLEILNKHIYNIQQMLNKRLKMRPIPRIIFVQEKRTQEAGRIEELLEEIHKKDVQ